MTEQQNNTVPASNVDMNPLRNSNELVNTDFDSLPSLQGSVQEEGFRVNPIEGMYESIKNSRSKSALEGIRAEKEDAAYFEDIFNSVSGPKKLSFQEGSINIDEAYTQLSDGTHITRYDQGFMAGANNEEIYAQRQSKTDKWANGWLKFGVKTTLGVVGGTAGAAWGLVSAIGEGNWENIYDNSFYDMLDDQSTKIDNFAANYRKQEEADMGFFESATTANFWADDVLGGLSFMAGTIVSEGVWAAATGGASIGLMLARASTKLGAGARAIKHISTAKSIAEGIKKAGKGMRHYQKTTALNQSMRVASKWGTRGKVADIARFTYTSAAYESGMEARLYQREQKSNFYRDFERLNGRKPEAMDIADFEDNLDKTTNRLFAVNMALVGTSNLAVLGKAFGMTSPFKMSAKYLDKTLFGKGLAPKVKGVAREALKRNKFQKTLGVTTALTKNMFFEGVVEEGGQATASLAMENYVTSRYNPSKDAMDMAESFYDGFAHTYGTKEGWKEVGLGMLIGLIGGEGSNVASRGVKEGLFKDARDAYQDQDENSVNEATNRNKNKAEDVLAKIMGSGVELKLQHATQIQQATEKLNEAETAGSVVGIANAQSALMLTSIKHADRFDYGEEQAEDMELALQLQVKTEEGKREFMAHYGVEENKVALKIKEIMKGYRSIMEAQQEAKTYSEHMISNDPRELFEGATLVDVELAKEVMTYQIVMASEMEKNMGDVHTHLRYNLEKMLPTLKEKIRKAFNYSQVLNKSSKEAVQAKNKAEITLKSRRVALKKLETNLKNLYEKQGASSKSASERHSDRKNELENERAALLIKIEEAVAADKKAGEDLAVNEALEEDLGSVSALQKELDAISNPLEGEDGLVSEQSIEEMTEFLGELDEKIDKVGSPQDIARIKVLAQEYQKGLTIWKRNADTVADFREGRVGLDRIGAMMQKKKQASEGTLNFLKRLQETQDDEEVFRKKVDALMLKRGKTADTKKTVKKAQTSNQKEVEEDKGEDITKETSEGIKQEIINRYDAQIKALRDEHKTDTLANKEAKINAERGEALYERKYNSQLERDGEGGFRNQGHKEIRNDIVEKLLGKERAKAQALLTALITTGKTLSQISEVISEKFGIQVSAGRYTYEERKFTSINDNYDAQIKALRDEHNAKAQGSNTEAQDSNEVGEEVKESIKEQIEELERKKQEELSQVEEEINPIKRKLAELKATLKEIVGKNAFLLENFSENDQLTEKDKPKEQDFEKYNELKDKKEGRVLKTVKADTVAEQQELERRRQEELDKIDSSEDTEEREKIDKKYDEKIEALKNRVFATPTTQPSKTLEEQEAEINAKRQEELDNLPARTDSKEEAESKIEAIRQEAHTKIIALEKEKEKEFNESNRELEAITVAEKEELEKEFGDLAEGVSEESRQKIKDKIQVKYTKIRANTLIKKGREIKEDYSNKTKSEEKDFLDNQTRLNLEIEALKTQRESDITDYKEVQNKLSAEQKVEEDKINEKYDTEIRKAKIENLRKNKYGPIGAPKELTEQEKLEASKTSQELRDELQAQKEQEFEDIATGVYSEGDRTLSFEDIERDYKKAIGKLKEEISEYEKLEKESLAIPLRVELGKSGTFFVSAESGDLVIRQEGSDKDLFADLGKNIRNRIIEAYFKKKDFSKGKKADFRGVPESEASSHIAYQSENAIEIAQAILRQEEVAKAARIVNLDTKSAAIALALKGQALKDSAKKEVTDLPTFRTSLRHAQKDKVGVDSVRESAEEYLQDEVTYDDILEHLGKYTTAGAYEATITAEDNTLIDLKGQFSWVVGVNPTTRRVKAILESEQVRQEREALNEEHKKQVYNAQQVRDFSEEAFVRNQENAHLDKELQKEKIVEVYKTKEQELEQRIRVKEAREVQEEEIKKGEEERQQKQQEEQQQEIRRQEEEALNEQRENELKEIKPNKRNKVNNTYDEEKKILENKTTTVLESSGEKQDLTEEEANIYENLKQKFFEWRMVTGTNFKGVSVQDLLDEIAIYEQDLGENQQELSIDQQLEAILGDEESASIGHADPDYVQTPSHVNIANENGQTVISHMYLDSVREAGFEVVPMKDAADGTERYTITKEGVSMELHRNPRNNRLTLHNDNVPNFLERMGLKRVGYKLKTAWGFLFKNGKALRSDFSIEDIDKNLTVLNEELLYAMKQGDKLTFSVSLTDKYNATKIQGLVEQGTSKSLSEAESNLTIYVKNEAGEVLGMVKAGATNKGDNFGTLRKAAFEIYKTKLTEGSSIEDLSNGDLAEDFTVPYTTTVEKIFIGTPNLQLDSEGVPQEFDIEARNFGKILSMGYSEKGKLSDSDPDIRTAYISKDVSGPYVVIDHKGSKVAFPITLSPTSANIQQQVLEILNSELDSNSKLLEVTKILRVSGIETADLDMNLLKDNSQELMQIIKDTKGITKHLTKKEVLELAKNKESFLGGAKILLNLDETSFLSPKMKTNISNTLEDVETGETTKDKGMTAQERVAKLEENKVILSQALTEKDVPRQVMKTGDILLIKEFKSSSKFKGEVVKFAMANKAVISLTNEEDLKEVLLDVLGPDSSVVPLDIVGNMKEELRKLMDTEGEITQEDIETFTKEVKKKLRNKYKVVNASVDTRNLYHIDTALSEKQMLEKGFVRVRDNFYKKVEKQEVTELQDGLYAKYKKDDVPEHLKFTKKEGSTEVKLTKEEFISKLGRTQLDIYKKYYNTQPKSTGRGKPLANVPNIAYLKEGFKKDLAEFMHAQRRDNTNLYKKVLSSLTLTSEGVTNADALTIKDLEAYKEELGDFYDLLKDYSLISKQMNLGVTAQKVIFAKDAVEATRLEAVNNPNLYTPTIKAVEWLTEQNQNKVGAVIALKSKQLQNKSFIEYRGGVFEKIATLNEANKYVYQEIAKVDSTYMVTEVREPLYKVDTTVDTQLDLEAGNVQVNGSNDLSELCS